jgi:hypothetical protein
MSTGSVIRSQEQHKVFVASVSSLPLYGIPFYHLPPVLFPILPLNEGYRGVAPLSPRSVPRGETSVNG